MPDAREDADRRQPSAWIERFAALVPPGGTVLDVACGAGRHARYFADRGHPVTALDRDIDAVRTTPGIDAIEIDLETGASWPLAGQRFDGIVVTNYLHRPLFPDLIAALAPGGVLLYETFGIGNERYGRPRNPDFLLRDGELLDRLGSELTVVAFESGVIETPSPAVIQRIVAVRRAGSDDAPVTLPAA